jgi:hypothetical protein
VFIRPFGLNRQFGSVFRFLKNSVFLTTATDRFFGKQKTDMFSFGFFGLVFSVKPKNRFRTNEFQQPFHNLQIR